MSVEGRLVEVEAWVDHDSVMDSWPRLEAGMGLLAQVHNRLRALEAGEEGRRPRFANHLASVELLASVRRGVERIRGWEPTPADRHLADLSDSWASGPGSTTWP